MKLIMAADHAGYKLKQKLAAELIKKGYEVMDLTPHYAEGDDYPGVANSLVRFVATSQRRNVLGTRDAGRGTMGVLICGSGIGVCIAANRHKGIRAGNAHDVAEVKLAREHNDINVLCLSGWKTKPADALKLVDAFAKTKTSTAARHKRRIKQLG